MYYKHNIHDKNQTSTLTLNLLSHTNALNKARGFAGLYPDGNEALV